MSRAALLTLALAFALALPAFAGYEEGVAAYERGDYETARREFLKAAEHGNADAQGALGMMYDNGYGVQKDDAEAVRWYRKAAEQGDAGAQFILGAMYTSGEGVQKDDAEAARWYRKAAEQGDASAQFILGVRYAKGKGVQKDYAEAVLWFRKAAEQRHAKAQFSLGLRYANGEGVSKDYAEAARWYRKSAEQGETNAQLALGMMYYQGEGVPKDYAEAARWFHKSAEQGEAMAQTILGAIYFKGEGVSRDYIEAYKWLNLAAAQGAENATEARELLQQLMTRSQIAQAQARTREWRPRSGSDAPGGGEAKRSAAPREPAPLANSVPPNSTGSGFFVSSAGHILTNDHIISGCARLRVSPPGGNAVIKARDRRNDLALLQMLRSSTGQGARPVLLRDRRARLGETAVVAGYPLRGLVGGGLNVTRGEVSALSGLGGDSRHLQITAPVQPGNSGGPLLDGSGHVLGVVVSKLNAIRTAQITGDIPQNVNFAIRVEVARFPRRPQYPLPNRPHSHHPLHRANRRRGPRLHRAH